MAQSQPASARDAVRATVPDLIGYTEKWLFGEVWERPQLSKRDRSLIVVATLIALGREKQLVGHLERALQNGLTKTELSEVITHLAFYAGCANAMSAVAVVKVFAARNIGTEQLPAVSVAPLPINRRGAARTFVQEQFGSTIPGVVRYTTDVLFRDL